MSRRKLGLALGAGSARGLAHIGVIQVLLEHGIQVDFVAGSSMGGIVGGLFAAGLDMYFLEKYAQKFSMKKYLDFSLRDGGLVRGRKTEQLIRLLTKNIGIEQTKIPFACVGVDLGTGELKTFRKNIPLYQAIRATISIPGVFAPYKIEDRYYIDGGILERVPVQAVKDLGADVVIGVDVLARGQEEEPPRNVIDTLQRTLSITDWYITKQKEHLADLLLTPDVYRGVDPYSSRDSQVCIQKGREAALNHLEDIQLLLE